MEVLSVLQCGLLSRSLLDSELHTKVRQEIRFFFTPKNITAQLSSDTKITFLSSSIQMNLDCTRIIVNYASEEL